MDPFNSLIGNLDYPKEIGGTRNSVSLPYNITAIFKKYLQNSQNVHDQVWRLNPTISKKILSKHAKVETASRWLVPIAISWELNDTVFHRIPFETSTESVLYSGIILSRRRMKNYSWYGEKMEKFFRKWCTAKNFVTFLGEVFPWAPSLEQKEREKEAIMQMFHKSSKW